MDEVALVELKARFQNERNKVLPKYTDPFDATVYYASLNGLTGQAFLNELRRIISTNITPTAYDDVRFILEKSDAVDSPWGTYLYGIYSGTKLVRYWDGGSTWNREHVWPNSKLGVKNQVDQAADPHNLRAISVSVNSYRSNRFLQMVMVRLAIILLKKMAFILGMIIVVMLQGFYSICMFDIMTF